MSNTPSNSLIYAPSLAPSVAVPSVAAPSVAASSGYTGKLLPGNIVPVKNTVTNIKLPDLPGTTNCVSTATYTNMNDIEIKEICNISGSTYTATDSTNRNININLGNGSSGQILNCPYSISMKKTNNINQVILDASCDSGSLSDIINNAQFKITSSSTSNDSYSTLYNSLYNNAITKTPTVTPAATPARTPTVTPAATPARTPTVTPAATPARTPTVTPTVTPSVTCPAGYKLNSKFIYNVNNNSTEVSNVCVSSFSITYPNPTTSVLATMCGNNAKSVLVDADTNSYKCMLNSQ